MDVGEKLAREGLRIQAIKLNTENPFTWASGYRMPIYNDNRMFLFDSEHRQLISQGLMGLVRGESYDVIAGTSTAGIPPATTLADNLGLPLIYVRDKPKDHGLRNQIEGIDAESGLEGRRVLLVEDLISTGGSSARAVGAIRDANGECNVCVSIFNYGLDKGAEAFRELDPACEVKSLLTYDKLLEVAVETNYINAEQAKMLAEWRVSPFTWGEKHG